MTKLTEITPATVRVLDDARARRMALRYTTEGKEYPAMLYPKGELDPDGFECLEDCAVFRDNEGHLVIAHMLPGTFEIV